jgi:hypothetical protein
MLFLTTKIHTSFGELHCVANLINLNKPILYYFFSKFKFYNLGYCSLVLQLVLFKFLFSIKKRLPSLKKAAFLTRNRLIRNCNSNYILLVFGIKAL